MTGSSSRSHEDASDIHIHAERDAIVADVMHLHVPPPAPLPVPRELPLDVSGFIGRTTELELLDQLLAADHDKGAPAVVITAVSGTPGVGKTALAIHWAHQANDRFPDGVLYTDLRGYDSNDPASPAEVLAAFLRSLGLTGNRIPDEVDERSARFRSMLHGRRMLVILDNAHDVEQVRPLLPGAVSCRVIVTSRDDLSALGAGHGAKQVDLDLLPTADAVQLLRTVIGEERAQAEPDAVELLAEYCVRLPLALRIAAQLAVRHPAVALTRFTSELADEQRRLSRLKAGGDTRMTVQSVFSWSYRYLSPIEAQAFRLLGLHPGRGFDAFSVSALLETGTEDGRDLTETLSDANLVQETRAGRFLMHDLLRAYASRLAAEFDSFDARKAARQRLFDYYLHTATAATVMLFPHERRRLADPPSSADPAPRFAGPAEAKAWFDAERPNLLAISAHSEEYGWSSGEEELATAVRRYLETGAHYTEALTIHGNALECARQRDDREAEAHELNSLAVIKLRQGRLPESRDLNLQALAIFEELRDRVAQGAVLTNLGSVELRLGNGATAVDHNRRSLALRREMSDRLGEGHALNNLGFVFIRLGLLEEALDELQQALVIFRELKVPTDETITLGNLGTVHRELGRYDEAQSNLQAALEISRETDDRASEGDVLKDMGLLLHDMGRDDEAVVHLERALTLSREVGDQNGELEAHNGLGEVLLRQHLHEQAWSHFAAALPMAAGSGARYEQARALAGLGHILRATDRIPEARRHLQQALEIYVGLDVPEADRIRTYLADLDGSEASAKP
ncbi:tetratricopeptide (TPR) repeat protein [Catenulispora sp. EB89]|uniref:ATP-binding protein n=1 Tax=Catenulispora sp. EB89 TaxID=3156257 RepID=UPI003519B1B4